MIDPSDVRRELKKITTEAIGKNADKQKAASMFQQLQGAIIDDLSKTGDQRTRLILKMIMLYKLPD